MEDLIREHVPHAPRMGLFVHPEVPADRLHNAIADYAHHVRRSEVMALYDATLSGNAKDGAVFAADRFIFQNTDLEAPQTVRYRDLRGVNLLRRWMGLGGKKIELAVNRGRSTFDLTMDFSGQPDAADHVARFLEAALQQREAGAAPVAEGETNLDAVRRALGRLNAKSQLSDADFDRIMAVLQEANDPVSPGEPSSSSGE